MSERHVLVLAGVDEPSAEMTCGIASVLIPAGWNVSYPLQSHARLPVRDHLRQFTAVLACDTAPEGTRESLSACRHVVGVRMDLTGQGFPSVVVDEEGVGRLAAEHLMANGLRHLSGFSLGRAAFATRRIGALREAAERAGVNWAAEFELTGGQFSLVGEWLYSLPKPIGILAGCDEWGRYLVHEAHQRGHLVPEQIQVVGVDNYTLACDVATTPLSSVNIPWRELGRRAASLLLDTLEHPPATPPLIAIPPVGVVVRRSSDLLCVDDPLVAQTLKVIRASASRPIGVPEILRQVPGSRRELEKAFRLALGRTIMQEVRRVHVELAKRLLAMRDLDMATVAQGSGFPNAEKLSVNFRKETGMPPSHYRRSLVGTQPAKARGSRQP